MSASRRTCAFGSVTARSSAREHGLDDVDPATTAVCAAALFQRIVAARAAADAADRRLQETAATALGGGASWTVIGAALDVTGQAARPRFGQA